MENRFAGGFCIFFPMNHLVARPIPSFSSPAQFRRRHSPARSWHPSSAHAVDDRQQGLDDRRQCLEKHCQGCVVWLPVVRNLSQQSQGRFDVAVVLAIAPIFSAHSAAFEAVARHVSGFVAQETGAPWKRIILELSRWKCILLCTCCRGCAMMAGWRGGQRLQLCSSIQLWLWHCSRRRHR